MVSTVAAKPLLVATSSDEAGFRNTEEQGSDSVGDRLEDRMIVGAYYEMIMSSRLPFASAVTSHSRDVPFRFALHE
jgi:hypothetical protein